MSDGYSTNAEVRGLKELNERLAKIGSLAQKEAANILTRTVALELARAARKNLKKFHRTGNLEKTVVVVRKKSSITGRIMYLVGNRTGKKSKNDGWYGRLLEKGTTPHIIRATRAKALGREGRLGVEVKHPGSRPYPWLEPAFEDNWQAALEKGRRKYERIIELKESAAGISNGSGE